MIASFWYLLHGGSYPAAVTLAAKFDHSHRLRYNQAWSYHSSIKENWLGMDSTKTTAPGGLLARLISVAIAVGFTLLTIYVFLLYLGQGSLTRLTAGLIPAAPAEKAVEGVYTLIGRDILYDQTQLDGLAGKPLTFNFRNAGALQHSLVFKLPSGELGVPATFPTGQGIPGGQTATLNVPALQPGTYDYYCNVPGHQAAMHGVLTIK
jgi:hypothetical protein